MELYKTRLFHHSLPSSPVTTPLSILDATVARFAPAGAIWLFDHFPDNIPEREFVDRLRSSFLQWAPDQGGGHHTERFNRPMVVYGTPNDPGVEWRVVKRDDISIGSLVPSAMERSTAGTWNGNHFPQRDFLCETPLALHDLREYQGLPGMQVQITLFKDGAYAVAVRMAHALADAQTLMVFMHQWAAASRAAFGSEYTESLMGAPVFNPALLDAHAAGDIDGAAPDPGLIATARELPLHRFDWWKTDDPGYPKVMVPNTLNSMPSRELLDGTELTPSASAPWTSWDLSRPIRYTQVHFSGDQLANFKRKALADGRGDISRLDALLAHLWISINRARNLANCPDSVFLDLSIGTRTRVSPPLPETFLGSPLFLTHVGAPAKSLCTASIGTIASKIRETVALFTAEKIGAVLHDAAYEASPQRLWQAFLGTRHVLVTSWLRLKVYGVEFVGDGNRPRYVHAVLPKLDGEVQVMESGVDDNGVDVALYLEEEAMERFLAEQRQLTA
ncbi:transferase family protein [Aspergillus novofumigatus IBT 16806]|uniref:Transferase family protein n=1 Tax=Aspergillus novofumigatus (strain IBT 16806) TaxID=1392255 RepID=A0A2I1C1G6_ASPN1|nr:transferase family protein [Aspergillus novofumigatus IBT 16806]PKX91472.1 transferase family protein [Aspergillus novofumigatus IBT 16806]